MDRVLVETLINWLQVSVLTSIANAIAPCYIVILFCFHLDTIFGNKKWFLKWIFFTIYIQHFSHDHCNCCWKCWRFSTLWHSLVKLFHVSLFAVSHVLLNHEDSSALSYPCRIFRSVSNHHEVVWPLERSNRQTNLNQSIRS